MNDSLSIQRYNSVAIILHWVMAIAFIGMLGSGFAMEYLDMEKSLKFEMMQLHKSTGVVLLIAVLFRFSWRMATKVPALPVAFPKWEKVAAHAGHWLLYLCMFAMPLSGWVMVSSSSYGLPTMVYNLFEWPHIHEVFSVFGDLQGNREVRGASGAVHTYVAFAFTAIILGHVGAVVKHRVKDGENLLRRMWWSGSASNESVDVKGES